MNDPYFQSKGKNKNLGYQQGKRYYRRYVIEEWDDKGEGENNAEKGEESNGMHVKITEPG